MIRTPPELIELRAMPGVARPVPGPNGTDVLSDALRLFRVSGTALLCGEYSAPWAWDAPTAGVLADLLHPGGARLVVFHIIGKGRCWLEVEGMSRLELEEGDVVGFPHGHGHRMGNGSGGVPFAVAKLFPPPPWNEVPVLRRIHGGEVTRIVCVYLRCDELMLNPLLDSLPSLLVVRRGEQAAAWIDTSVRYIIAEMESPRFGSAALIGRLTELLFIEILRNHIANLRENDVGWLAALNDRYIGRALHALHARLAEPWTAEQLARHAGLSRSALDERFRGFLRMSPMRYLTVWRLQQAAHALRGSQTSIADIAAQVGYGSEEALSRAFKRLFGVSPGAWRTGVSACVGGTHRASHLHDGVQRIRGR
jgi:AraC family transcriptional regulator, alkane utilization regulator